MGCEQRLVDPLLIYANSVKAEFSTRRGPTLRDDSETGLKDSASRAVILLKQYLGGVGEVFAHTSGSLSELE
jgi:hypothetical protein